MEYTRAKYVDRLVERKQNGLIKVITGARRSGKSYLMNELYYKCLLASGVPSANIIRFAFDADEDIDLLDSYFPNEETKLEQKNGIYYINAKKFRAYIKDRTNDKDDFYLLLDEVQLLDNFIGTLNSFLRHKNLDVYVTGSNSKLLSGELATLLTGRYLTINVYPFSFKEFLQYKNEIEGIELTKDSINRLYDDYFNFGGMPGILSLGSDEFRKIALKDIFNSILFEDVVSRFKINNVDLLQRFSRYMISSTGEIFSSKSIKNYLKSNHIYTSQDTLLKYNEYLNQSFFISKCKCFELKGRNEMKILGKYYLTDHGFHHALIEDNMLKVTKILENIVYVELLRRGYKVNVGRSRDNSEVDFVCEKSGRYKYVQVSYRLSNEKTLNREIAPLLRIPDKYESILITTENHDFSKDGVRHLNIIDFLCGDDL